MEFRFSYTTPLPVEKSVVFDWHKRPGAFERLAPTWMPLHVKGKSGGIAQGDWVKLGVGPFGLINWKLVHGPYEEGTLFTDQQESGPFRYWKHTHRFEAVPQGTYLHDEITYQLPFGFDFLKSHISRQCVRLFHQRAEKLQFECRYPGLMQAEKPLTIALTGSSGLIGSSLIPLLQLKGHKVIRLVRQTLPLGPDERFYNPETGDGLPQALEGCDAVIHLAGESIAGFWTEAKKKAIAESRILSTRRLVEAITRMQEPPRHFIMASGAGYYGSSKSPASETHPKGTGFLAQVVEGWENALLPLAKTSCRIVVLRLAPVLSPMGGMLKPMILPHKIGLGASWGDPKMPFSWISLEDATAIFYAALTDNQWEGIFNVAAPETTTPQIFSRTLAKQLGRSQWLHLPATLLKIAGREAAENLLLTPSALDIQKLQSRYRFRFPVLNRALRFLLATL